MQAVEADHAPNIIFNWLLVNTVYKLLVHTIQQYLKFSRQRGGMDLKVTHRNILMINCTPSGLRTLKVITEWGERLPTGGEGC